VVCFLKITDLNFIKTLRSYRRLTRLDIVKAIAFEIVAL